MRRKQEMLFHAMEALDERYLAEAFEWKYWKIPRAVKRIGWLAAVIGIFMAGSILIAALTGETPKPFFAVEVKACNIEVGDNQSGELTRSHFSTEELIDYIIHNEKIKEYVMFSSNDARSTYELMKSQHCVITDLESREDAAAELYNAYMACDESEIFEKDLALFILSYDAFRNDLTEEQLETIALYEEYPPARGRQAKTQFEIEVIVDSTYVPNVTAFIEVAYGKTVVDYSVRDDEHLVIKTMLDIENNIAKGFEVHGVFWSQQISESHCTTVRSSYCNIKIT